MMTFTPKEHTLLTSSYFKLIRTAPDFYEVQSHCTGHCWILQKSYFFDQYPVLIYHKHGKGKPYYHRHGQATTICSAIRQITNHDTYVLNGRRSFPA